MEEERVEYDLSVLFDLAPDRFAWRAPIPRQIEQRRADLADALIFDILLTSGGIKHPASLYPPRDEHMLRKLLNAIEGSEYDSLKKDCLVYFLLRWHKDGREERFRDDRCISPQFAALADAYWFLDSGEDVPSAISLLSDARLNRDYTSKILQVIALEKENANSLILRYVRTAKPLLTEPDDIDAYSIALAESSLLEAWQYQRTFSEDQDIRPRIFRNILRWCLAPKPQSKALTQLLSFPLSNYEQSLLHEFALRPPSKLPIASVSAIQDLACVRLIHHGQLAAAVRLDRKFAITPIRGSFGNEQAKKVAQDRKQTMDDIMSILPSAERQLLELELEQMSQSTETAAYMNGSAVTDLSMSWEHIRPPKASGSSPANSSKAKPAPALPSTPPEPPILPIPLRSGAPRFGGPSPRRVSASTAFSAVREMFDNISKPSTPKPQAKPLGPSDTDPLISSIEAPSVGKQSPPSHSISTRPLSNKRKDPISLFESVGSAKKAPNAFFQPQSSVSASAKRTHPEEPMDVTTAIHPADISTGSALDVSTMLRDGNDSDTEMQNAASEEPQGKESPTREEQDPLAEVAEEFAVSVFGHNFPAQPSSGLKRSRSPAEDQLAPPGAFAHESEDENAHEFVSSEKMLLDEEDLPPPPPPPSTRKTRNSIATRRVRAPALKKEPSLSHSVPGAFIPDEDDDVVPPLPPVTPGPRRQTRKTRAIKTEEEPPKETTRVTRRSSRLSVVSASERGSSSPEPVSPERERRPRLTKTTRQTPGGASSRIPRSRKQR